MFEIADFTLENIEKVNFEKKNMPSKKQQYLNKQRIETQLQLKSYNLSFWCCIEGKHEVVKLNVIPSVCVWILNFMKLKYNFSFYFTSWNLSMKF